MSERKSHVEIERGSERSFGVVFTAVFLLLGLAPYFINGEIYYWLLVIAVAFSVITLLMPKLFTPLNILWFKFGMFLGFVVAPIVMMLIFYLVVTPIGLLMRAFGKDPLRLKRNPGQTSYWIERKPDLDNPESMNNQF